MVGDWGKGIGDLGLGVALFKILCPKPQGLFKILCPKPQAFFKILCPKPLLGSLFSGLGTLYLVTGISREVRQPSFL